MEGGVVIVVGSAWRDSAARVPSYMALVRELAGRLARPLRVVAVEGDSRDQTREELAYWAERAGLELDLRTCAHGGPYWGSVESPERFRALSRVCDAIFDAVRGTDDLLLYVESDLLWEPRTAATLLARAGEQAGGFDVHAPLVMAGALFYDLWAFRGLDGRRFSPFSPFWPGLDGAPVEVGSVGSCLAMRGEVARVCRVRDDMCLVGWCADARARGYKIGVWPDLEVRQA